MSSVFVVPQESVHVAVREAKGDGKKRCRTTEHLDSETAFSTVCRRFWRAAVTCLAYS